MPMMLLFMEITELLSAIVSTDAQYLIVIIKIFVRLPTVFM